MVRLLSPDETKAKTHAELEIEKCSQSPEYFIDSYCYIYDNIVSDWIPFKLWDAQKEALTAIVEAQMSIHLKARQVGLTWLSLGYALWQMLFRPIATVLIFSKRDDEAVYLLSGERLRGMYAKLPAWMKQHSVETDDKHQWRLSNGSVARAFPTSAGDSYTATLVIVDEADLVPDLKKLLGSAKPTIDAGGKMLLVSRVDKATPNSMFKQIYRAAKQGLNAYRAVFIPWFARPGRTADWYATQCADAEHNSGSLDDVYEQYPANDAEALAAKTLDKRFKPAWVLQCYDEQPFVEVGGAPAIPQLELYVGPQPGHTYVIGADPAEGNPGSDDSAATVMDKGTGEEVAALAGHFEPSVFGGHLDALSRLYFNAPILVERNNHGHAVLLWLRDNSKAKRVNGWDGREGWLSSTKGNTLLYDGLADALRDGTTTIHSFATQIQIASIEGASLSAPEGEHDDRADSYALAYQATSVRVETVQFSANVFYPG